MFVFPILRVLLATVTCAAPALTFTVPVTLPMSAVIVPEPELRFNCWERKLSPFMFRLPAPVYEELRTLIAPLSAWNVPPPPLIFIVLLACGALILILPLFAAIRPLLVILLLTKFNEPPLDMVPAFDKLSAATKERFEFELTVCDGGKVPEGKISDIDP